MVAKGDLFTIEVDGVEYFPLLLAAPELDLKRLRSICRILAHAPPSCRLGYLSARHANLGGISPSEALHGDKSCRLLRRMAHAYAAEWSRTSVAIYVRHYLQEPGDIEPTLTAVDEIDPRVNIWKRAAGALRNGGYIHPCGPYPRASAATVFFARHLAGRTEAIPEARVDVSIDEGIARVFVVRLEEPGYELDAIPVTGADNIVDLVLRIVAAASKRESTVGMKQAVLCEAEPSSIALTEPSIRDS